MLTKQTGVASAVPIATKDEGGAAPPLPAVGGGAEMVEAIVSEASGEEIARCELPSGYTAAYLSREDEGIFEGERDKDVRRTIHVGEVEMPEPGPDEAVVAVMASSINHNTIWSAIFEPVSTFRFLERLKYWGDPRHDLPHHVIGSDAAGIVVRVGSAVRRWSVGDRVTISPGWPHDEDPSAYGDSVRSDRGCAWGYETNFGGLGCFALVKQIQLLPKPRHLTWEEAACNQLCAMTAYRMLVGSNGARIKQGDIVLVWGAAGGLGGYAIQFIRNGGGIAVGVVNSEEKASLLERLGCDVILRRDQLDVEGLTGVDLGKKIKRQVRTRLGEDAHVVFDYVGRQTFGASVYLVRTGGSVVTCGSSTGYEHEFDNRYLWMKVKRILGCHGANRQESWETNRLVSLGRIVPALSKVYPLEQAAEATRAMQENRHMGKVGVLCLAREEGRGVDDPELRAAIGEERLRLFRDFAA